MLTAGNSMLGTELRIGGGANRMRRRATPEGTLYPTNRQFPIDSLGLSYGCRGGLYSPSARHHSQTRVRRTQMKRISWLALAAAAFGVASAQEPIAIGVSI